MFDKKRDAEQFLLTARTEVREGAHVAHSASATVSEAGKLWITARTRAGRGQTTIAQYQQHLDHHIVPFIGNEKLTSLTAPLLRKFEDRLLDEGRSKPMVRKVLVSLGSLLADAQERGLVARNVVRDMRGRRGSSDTPAEKRAKGKLRVGVDIPSPQEIKAIVVHLEGRWRPLLLTAIFTGMRASELRGLTWANVDLAKKVIHVRQRADRFAVLGKPKSEAGERDVPMPPIVVKTLKEWKLAGTKSERAWCSRTCTASHRRTSQSCATGSCRHRSGQVWSLARARKRRRNNLAFMPCAISMRPGASTAGKMAGWACRRKLCRNG